MLFIYDRIYKQSNKNQSHKGKYIRIHINLKLPTCVFPVKWSALDAIMVTGNKN